MRSVCGTPDRLISGGPSYRDRTRHIVTAVLRHGGRRHSAVCKEPSTWEPVYRCLRFIVTMPSYRGLMAVLNTSRTRILDAGFVLLNNS